MVIHYVASHPNTSTNSIQTTHFDGEPMSLFVGIELPHPLIKYTAAFLYFFLSLSGLTINIVWGVILYLGHRNFSQRPFYIVSRHLMISDCLCVIGQLAAAAPLTLMDYRSGMYFHRTTFFNYFAILETVGRFSTLIFVFLQALSQIAPFMPNHNRLAHHLSASGSLICMFGWIANIGLMTWFLVSKCRKDFGLRYFKFFYDCSQNSEMGETLWIFIHILTITVIISGLGIYGTGLRTLQKSLKMCKTFTSMEAVEKREFGELKRVRLVLLQGFFIILMTFCRTIAFTLIPTMADNLSLNSRAIVNVFANCVELLSSSVHPLVYIVFSERARKYLQKIIIIVLRKKVDEEQIESIMADANSMMRTT